MKKTSLKTSLSKVTKRLKKKSLNFRIPAFKEVSLNMYLVFVLVIFAFFLGMLTNKVFDLQSQISTMSKANTVPTTAAAQALPLQPTTPAGPVNVSVGNFPAQGDSNAKVTVIEFADLRCPFCEQWFQNVEPNIINDYVKTGKVKFYFRNYAFLGPASTLAANAGECANDQGQFWAFHDYMYQHQPDESDTSMYTVDNLSQIAGTLGMDQSQFQSCLSANQDNDKVTKDMSDGQAAGVSGTPTTFINGVAIVGAVPYSQIKAAIDKDLN